MKLTILTDYALRVLMYGAKVNRRFTAGEAADYFRVSADHVVKAVHLLGQQGFVINHRGRGGGVELARSADEITVAEVVVACEGTPHLLDCTAVENVCVIQDGCRLKHVLSEAVNKMMEHLGSVTIAEVVRTSRALAV